MASWGPEYVPTQPPQPLTVPSQSYAEPVPARSISLTEESDPHHGHSHTGHSHSAAHRRRGGSPRRTRSPSPRFAATMRLSPLPSSKRLLEKKPALACLFCRGRKIACGPPVPGSKDKTCNQCARRHLKCEYPLESRRGMRKRKASASTPPCSTPANVNVDGPKVTVKASRKR
ncbi:hypothetical protein SERLA73DRAFT_168168 [Serpula lacrymans var. lacrymans S7.3]|uniref:Zn(2)-C6 fungal-type domain-containing protein n=2 Tax=Serpula lacrymans var. lacrymans TaxID=341189 RepID=F8PUA8_SERL3|nr:uncharacterized protein SERLADRAFT_448869 [Serpula lacrymans var. lacrymans S7.9]EGO00421.1 hypothetical protein SERLA73DRAFT_168168 [Serpula lacrymans var. lacrymans S7.3]EGO25979.1 hypothetical protein SERLADRAFT_448869 [Serpula lacrymans var. lacrymans S7.9]